MEMTEQEKRDVGVTFLFLLKIRENKSPVKMAISYLKNKGMSQKVIELAFDKLANYKQTEKVYFI